MAAEIITKIIIVAVPALLSRIWYCMEKLRKNSLYIHEGMVLILKNEIINTYYERKEKGYCNAYIKERITDLYEIYKNFGGDGTVQRYYENLMEMSEEKR